METTIIAGNIGKKPELRRSPDHDPRLVFSVAVDQGKDKSGNKRDSKWFDCTIFGKRAEALEPYLAKGMKVTVSGRVSAREYQGKAYLQLAVNEITMQGGGSRYGDESQSHGDSQESAHGGSYDDEIPF